MKKSLALLAKGFQSSSGLTPEFKLFFSTFKKEFTKELEFISATDIQFSRGHFYVSGFFTVGEQAFYFSLPDVRGNSPIGFKLLYRTAKNYKDYQGGMNCYAIIQEGMGANMKVY